MATRGTRHAAVYGPMAPWEQGLFAVRRLARRRLLAVSVAAVFIGLTVGVAALGFRYAIQSVQALFFGTFHENLIATMGMLPWWRIVLAPVIGGLLVGLVLQWWRRERPAGIADVIDCRARGNGRMPLIPAFAHAGLSALSLGAGASLGREGPTVHLGAALSSHLARTAAFPPRYARMLLACGAGAAVSAAFNAPIAGTLFAFEVVLGSYALRAMAPVTLASVTGALVTRIALGTEDPAFRVPEPELGSYLEMPAFVALGLISAALAIALIQALKYADAGSRKVPMPLWLRPVVGGLCIGLLALAMPEILGVGYGAIDAALREDYGLGALLLLILGKILASAICFASRFGGGVFTPSIFVGAMAGGAFGGALNLLLPDQVTGMSFYAMVGMGAVGAAVLGAPLSTSLIVFELTGGYAITIALLVSSSLATLVTQTTLGHSFFQWQLNLRGLDLTVGTYTTVLNTIRVSELMDRERQPRALPHADAPVTFPEASLEKVLALLEENDLDQIPVVTRAAPDRVIGTVSYKDALLAYNHALVRTNIEEHQ